MVFTVALHRQGQRFDSSCLCARVCKLSQAWWVFSGYSSHCPNTCCIIAIFNLYAFRRIGTPSRLCPVLCLSLSPMVWAPGLLQDFTDKLCKERVGNWVTNVIIWLKNSLASLYWLVHALIHSSTAAVKMNGLCIKQCNIFDEHKTSNKIIVLNLKVFTSITSWLLNCRSSVIVFREKICELCHTSNCYEHDIIPTVPLALK